MALTNPNPYSRPGPSAPGPAYGSGPAFVSGPELTLYSRPLYWVSAITGLILSLGMNRDLLHATAWQQFFDTDHASNRAFLGACIVFFIFVVQVIRLYSDRIVLQFLVFRWTLDRATTFIRLNNSTRFVLADSTGSDIRVSHRMVNADLLFEKFSTQPLPPPLATQSVIPQPVIPQSGSSPLPTPQLAAGQSVLSSRIFAPAAYTPPNPGLSARRIKTYISLAAIAFVGLTMANKAYKDDQITAKETAPTSFDAATFTQRYAGQQWITVTGYFGSAHYVVRRMTNGDAYAEVPLTPRGFRLGDPVNIIAILGPYPYDSIRETVNGRVRHPWQTITGLVADRTYRGEQNDWIHPSANVVFIQENDRPHGDTSASRMGVGIFLVFASLGAIILLLKRGLAA